MNSVISAFKTKKSSNNSSSVAATAGTGASPNELKQNGSLVGLSIASVGNRKKPVAQENGYQYLRQIREIESANKLLSPVVAVAAEDLLHNVDTVAGSDLVSFRPAAVVDATSTCDATSNGGGVDVVDHCAPAMVRLSPDSHSDYNMNGGKLSNGCKLQLVAENGNMDICALPCGGRLSPVVPDDDDNSEHSTAACTSTSSSSEHSNSTVVHSPTVVAAPPQSSTSTSTSLHSLELPLSVVTMNGGGADNCSSQTPLASPVLQQAGHEDYVPAFLKAPPLTLPLSAASTPAISSAASTPKHARYSKPRLSLSRGFNHSMPSVHGRPNLSVAPASSQTGQNGAAGQPPKRISTHQRNLSLDFR